MICKIRITPMKNLAHSVVWGLVQIRKWSRAKPTSLLLGIV